MQNLTTLSTKLTGASAVVEWWLSDNKCGRFHVNLPTPSESTDVIAELCVIRHLIFERMIFVSGCVIRTHNKKSILTDCALVDDEKLDVDLVHYGLAQIVVETPAIGDVTITAHSIERYQDRVIAESGECLYPLPSLIKRLANPENKKQVVPISVQEHKTRKYGEQDEFEVWKHPTATLNFGIIRNKQTGKRTLVTTYIRKEKY
ncbi:MAG: hypothetical protein IE914_04275 [Thiotrichales bacterium]|nr:hypothetical protein [Thiotrichales bacterium]